jgi:ribokinase
MAMSRGGRVIVVGSVNVDLVATAERLPVPGETLTGSTFAQFDGGKGANQAVAAARLGMATAFVGAVGRDAFAMRARAALQGEGIDLRGLRTVDGPTGVALILVDAHGENLISVASGANATFAAADVTAAFEELAPAPGDVVLVGHEIPTLAAKHALRSARTAGATTVFNPAPASGVERSVFGFADILTANELELAAILAADGEPAPGGAAGGASTAGHPAAGAEALLAERHGEAGVARAVVVTHGAAGAEIVETGRRSVTVPAPTVAAIDAVGAGDTFAGALAAGILAHLDLDLAVRRAVAAASLSTTRPGARGGMPTAPELEAFLRAR